PDPFIDVDGRVYLLWKSDGELVGSRAAIWTRRLADDGLTFDRHLSPWARAHRLLRQDAVWESPLIEAPSLLHHDDRYYLFYSAGRWTDASYAVGYAEGATVQGAFVKMTGDGPWLTSRPGAAGPGGQCLVRDADGLAYLAYHAWDPAAVGYANGGARRLHVDRLGGRPPGPPPLRRRRGPAPPRAPP